MATEEQIEALKIDENVFELTEDTELEYLVHFAAPFTGGDKCVVPKGTAFAPHSPMRGDVFYMHLTLPLKFRNGSAERLLQIMCQLRSPVYPIFP